MNYSELIKLSGNYHQYRNGETTRFEFTAIPRRTILDKNKNTVYSQGISVIVNIDRFKDEDKFQIYRATGHHVLGNSHKCYESLSLLFEDFEIRQDEYLSISVK